MYILYIYIYTHTHTHISEKAMAPHCSSLAWRIPWTEEPGRLQSIGLLRFGHDWVTSLSLFTFHFYALEKEVATHSSILAMENPMDRGAWQTTVLGVAKESDMTKQLNNNILIWIVKSRSYRMSYKMKFTCFQIHIFNLLT